MQENALGHAVEDLSRPQRGDLVFWKGHVAIMEDENTILHANGHTMSVARENLDAAIERIGWLYEQPTGYRRP
jgi:cell wall-associated NlpC family hydrolase